MSSCRLPDEEQTKAQALRVSECAMPRQRRPASGAARGSITIVCMPTGLCVCFCVTEWHVIIPVYTLAAGRAHRTADAAAACASTMKDNVVSRNFKGWVATAFKTALFCQFVRVFSYQTQTSSRILVAIVAMWIGWVAFGLLLVRRTLALCDELPPYRVIRTGELARETLPPSDAMYSVVLYEWRFFGSGWLFRLMARKYLGTRSWGTAFAATGKDAAAEVRAYCARYGIPEEPWPWCNAPQDYESMAAFVCRSYAHGRAPPMGEAAVTSPAAGVVRWYDRAAELPPLLNLVPFALPKCGVPEEYCADFEAQPCACIHITAADYRWVHAPCAGMLLHAELTSRGMGPHSRRKNEANPTNRRAVLLLETRGSASAAAAATTKASPDAPGRQSIGCCALVLVGSLDADSVRLEPGVEAGVEVARGQRLGCFAGGGSAAALCFFDRPVALVEACAAVHGIGMAFHLDCGASLAQLPGGGGGGGGGGDGGDGGGDGGGGGSGAGLRRRRK